jgi:hypothetical protein
MGPFTLNKSSNLADTTIDASGRIFDFHNCDYDSVVAFVNNSRNKGLMDTCVEDGMLITNAE